MVSAVETEVLARTEQHAGMRSDYHGGWTILMLMGNWQRLSWTILPIVAIWDERAGGCLALQGMARQLGMGLMRCQEIRKVNQSDDADND